MTPSEQQVLSMNEPLQPVIFTRNNLMLHAWLIEAQVWFCAYDIGRLIGCPFNARTTRKLDPDQHRTRLLHCHGQPQQTLIISESGLYAMLVHHYYPDNRHLRRWITQQVVPSVRDGQLAQSPHQPSLSVMAWPDNGKVLSLLHWQDEPWMRLRDMPYVLPHRAHGSMPAIRPWWRKVFC
jgi:prophage antirepressor-like protein